MPPRRISTVPEDGENNFYWEYQGNDSLTIQIDPDPLLAEIKAENEKTSPREEVLFSAGSVTEDGFFCEDEFLPEDNLMDDLPSVEVVRDGSVSPPGSSVDDANEIIINNETCFIDENSVEPISDGEMEDPLALSDDEVEVLNDEIKVLNDDVGSVGDSRANQHSGTLRVRPLEEMRSEQSIKPSDAVSFPQSQETFSDSCHSISPLKTHAQKIQCPDCHKRFCTEETLEAHQKRKHSDQLYAQIKFFQCPICPRRYKLAHNLEQHLKNLHKEVCQQSSPQTSLDWDSRTHYETDRLESFEPSSVNSDTNSSAPKAQCSFCPQQFLHHCDLMMHLTAMHADLKFTRNLKEFEQRCRSVNSNGGDELLFHCEICLAQFYDRSELVEHTALHSSSAPVKCEPDEQRNLSPHFEDSLKFDCAICGAEFCDRSELAEHAVHCTPTVFETTRNANSTSVCEICSVQFSDADQLAEHVQHLHQCFPAVTQSQEQSCPSTPVNHNVSDSILPSNSVQTQPPSQSLQCKFCPQIFRRRSNLTTHLKRKHSDKLDVSLEDGNKKRERRKTLKVQTPLFHPSDCSEGTDSVITPKDQDAHEAIIITLDEDSADSVKNRSITPYYCQFCPSEFYRRCNLMRHLVASHSKTQRPPLAPQNSSSEIGERTVHRAPAKEATERCSSSASNNENQRSNICEIPCIQFTDASELANHPQHHSHQFIPTLQARKQCPSTATPEISNPVLSQPSSVTDNAGLPAQDIEKKSDILSTHQSNVMLPPILSDLSKQHPRLVSSSKEALSTARCVDKLSDVPPALSPFAKLESMQNNTQCPVNAKLYRCEYCFETFCNSRDLMKHLVIRHPDEYVDPFMLKPGKLLLRV